MTSKITEFNRISLKELRQSISDALSTVANQHSITLSIGAISFNSHECSARLKGVVGTDTTEHSRKDWDKNCMFFGFKPGDFGREFSYAGDKYKIVGIKPRSSKYPILAKQLSNGKTYKLPTDLVKLQK